KYPNIQVSSIEEFIWMFFICYIQFMLCSSSTPIIRIIRYGERMKSMLKFFRKISNFSSDKRGAKIVLSIWILAVIILSAVLPFAKDYGGSSGEGSTTEDRPSEIAEEVLKEQFPSKEGLPALLVFHDEGEISTETKEQLTELSEWLASDDKPEEIISALPYH